MQFILSVSAVFFFSVIFAFNSAYSLSCTSAPRVDGTLGCVWQTQLNPTDVGKAVTKEMLFGSTGVKANTVGSPQRAYVGKAPDGTIAVELRVPQGSVPAWDLQSKHLAGRNVTQAAIAFETWLPSSFRFPSKCSGGALPGQGRWAYGMWIGNSSSQGKMGGGIPLASQDGITVRLNRRGGSDGQLGGVGMYVYNLNRGMPQCSITGTCSVNCSGGVTGKCYGYSGSSMEAQGLPRDRWVRFEMLVKMNDPGKKNGSVTIWRDGQPYQYKTGFDLGRDRGWSIQGFTGYEMWHCQPSPKAQSYWFKNLRLYANTVKPSASVASEPVTTSSTAQATPVTSPNGSVRKPFVLRIDSGSSKNYTAPDKAFWIADRHFKNGKMTSSASNISPIAKSWRYASGGYAVPVPYGAYIVKLHFTENNSRITAVGKRVFDIEVEDKKTLAFDAFKEAGGRGKPIVKTYDVITKDGVININLIARKDNTMISGVEILSK